MVEQKSPYSVNDHEVTPDEFIRVATNPHQSVVVEACAGSGKTYLLVSRMLRILLNGAKPSEVLAITFTRKAAQEMRQRLMSLLESLALAAPEQVKHELSARGLSDREIVQAVPRVKALYAEVLAHPERLNTDTFHGWFGRIVKLAPIASGVPHGFDLIESCGDVRSAAYRDLMRKVNDPQHTDLYDSMCALLNQFDEQQVKKELNSFLEIRAEWWAFNQGMFEGNPHHWLEQLIPDGQKEDARLSLWQDSKLLQRIGFFAQFWGKGTGPNQREATLLEMNLSGPPSVEAFEGVCDFFFTKAGTLRKRKYNKELQKNGASFFADELAFFTEFEALSEELNDIKKRRQDQHIFAINQHLFRVGQTYIECYQDRKLRNRKFDFNDLEWQAFRLLRNAEWAAYLQARLDARYRHILLDEFQDTNPIQWGVVQAWLDAYQYGDDTSAPSLFVVGDPKQSIYRFRRAEPRVFEIAQARLQALGALVLKTNQTRRNSLAVVASLNQSMSQNPLFDAQQTTSNSPGEVWVLPLVDQGLDDSEDTSTDAAEVDGIDDAAREGKTDLTVDNAANPIGADNPWKDPLTERDIEVTRSKHYFEGLQVSKALIQLREKHAFHWQDVMLLVRTRTAMAHYESALREAGIPFISDKRGGLLDKLEISDIRALLNLLITPSNNLALAQVLKSPLFFASDSDLILLAEQAALTKSPWWVVLHSTTWDAPVLNLAQQRLDRWKQAASVKAVHDLLDQIYFEGELIERYAQSVPSAQREQTVANLYTFLELALNHEGGRFPSLQKFINELSRIARQDEKETPDEAPGIGLADAVRLMTIHSAKGLEAKVVVLMGAHSKVGKKDAGKVLCNWPLEEHDQPAFSYAPLGKNAGLAQADLIQKEEKQALQENLNVLYVAVTRAKEILLVSGVTNRSKKLESWYTLLQENAAPFEFANLAISQQDAAQPDSFSLQHFQAQDLSLEKEADSADSFDSGQSRLEGIALHSLMERLCHDQQQWPIEIPSADDVSDWLHCSLSIAETVTAQAQVILKNPDMRALLDPSQFDASRNEMELMYQGQLLRLDRVVIRTDEVIVMDYKRNLHVMSRRQQTAQVATYQQALKEIYPNHRIRACLISSNGDLLWL